MATFKLRRNSWGGRCLALQEMYNSSSLSDVTICFADRRIHAHKVVLSMASDYFKSAFTGHFAESKSNELWLHDDDPDAVDGMIRWIYDLEPTTSSKSSQDHLEMNLKFWTVGGKYQLLDLMLHAANTLEDQLGEVHLRPNAIWADLKQEMQSLLEAGTNRGEIISQFECNLCLTSVKNPLVTSCLHTYCTRCYTDRLRYGRKCNVCDTQFTSIVRCQLDKFDIEETTSSCSVQEFVSSIKAIYHTVPAHDGRLQTIVAALCRDRMASLLLEQEFLSLLMETPELAIGLIKVVGEEDEREMDANSIQTLPQPVSDLGGWGD